jgi:hypothetical protein
VSAGVRVTGRPIGLSSGSTGNVRDECGGDGALVGFLIPAIDQVFGERPMVEPVNRSVGNGAALHDERAGMVG